MSFVDLISELELTYGLTLESDYLDLKDNKSQMHNYKSIIKASQNDVELFRLYWITDESDTDSVLISFKLSLLNSEAIQWFSKVKYYYPKVLLTESYAYDDNNVLYTGSTALQITKAKQIQEAAEYYGKTGKKVYGVRQERLSLIDLEAAYQKLFSATKPPEGSDTH